MRLYGSERCALPTALQSLDLGRCPHRLWLRMALQTICEEMAWKSTALYKAGRPGAALELILWKLSYRKIIDACD